MPLSRLPRLAVVLISLGLGWFVVAQDPEKPKEVVATFSGHQESVYGVALSPDGKLLLTASFDKTVKLWDAPGGKELRTFGGDRGHQNLVLAVQFAPDGRTFASGGSDNTVKIWDVPLAKPLRELALADAVTATAASPDGKSLAAAGKDGAVSVWNAADAKPAFRLTGHVGAVTGFAYSNNGQLLASTGVDQTLRFWNPTTGQPVATVGAHPAAVTALALSPGGNTAYTAGADGTLKVWQMPPVASRPLAGHTDTVHALATSTDGALTVTGSADKSVRFYQTESGQLTRTLTAPEAVRCVSAAVSGSNGVVAAGTAGGKLLVWAGDGKPQFLGPTGGDAVVGVAINANATQLLTLTAGGELKLWPLPITPAKARVLTTGASAAAYHPGGTQVVVAGKDKSLKLLDAASGKELRKFGPLPDVAAAVAVSRDGQQLAAATGKLVKVWTAADGKELQTLAHPGAVVSLAFSPDRTRLVTGTTDNVARVWDLAAGKELQSFSHGAAVHAVAFHPTKPTSVLTASADRTAAVHALTIQRTIPVAAGPVRSITVVPNGAQVVTAAGRDVKLWNLGNGNLERTFPDASAEVLAVAVSRNGALLATAGADKTVRLYNFNDATPIGSFPTPGVVRSLSFHPNNQALLTAGDDRAATAWGIAFQPGNPPPPEFGKPLQTFAHGGAVPTAGYMTDGTTLLSGSDDKVARVWKVAADGPTKNLQHPNLVDAVAYNKDGSLLATACHDGVVRIWDVAKGTAVKQINAHTQPQPSPVYAVAWSPDYKQLATASLDRSIKVWDAAAGTLVKEIKGYDEKAAPKGHRDGVFTVAFSPDGKQLVTGSSDRTIKMWTVADGAFVREFVNPNLPTTPMQPPAAHPGWIYHLRFTPDGAHVVSVGGAPRNRGYIAVWTPADGKLRHAAELPLGPFHHVALAPDGTAAVACGPRSRQSPQADAVLLRLPVK